MNPIGSGIPIYKLYYDVQSSPRLPASPVRQSDKPLGNTIEPRAGIFPFQYCANMIYFSQELGK